MDKKITEKMKEIVGDDWVVDNAELMERYFKDETVPSLVPKINKDCIVVKPENAEEISDILKFATENNIAVIARGGGTGLAAGVVPIKKSIILSMERFNKILELDKSNFTITC